MQTTDAHATTSEDVRQEIIDTVRKFVAREVMPVASEFEHEDRFPADIIEQMRSLGLFGITIPEAYGGLGLDLLTYIGVIE
jgi:alkylation response protein AidB-like acyl-CoA dehydrogenase